MKHYAPLIVLVLVLGCRKPVKTDPAPKLKSAMTAFLKKSIGSDSGSIHFQVFDVAYFADKGFYDCEFHVRMVSPNGDTTGMMKARISDDFEKVTRNW